MKSKDKVKILIVDDEPDIVELLSYNLRKEGYLVETAPDGKKAIDSAKSFLPHVIILDIMMPVIDGIETCRQIKELPELNAAYVLFLTARTEEYSEVAAFDAGADDFLPKPIRPKALISRISAIVQRENKQKKEAVTSLNVSDLVIDRNTYKVVKSGQDIILPRKEFELLFFLASNPGKVYNRDELLQKVWGTDVYVLSRTVDVHIRKVREKLGDDYITTIKGVGYKFSTN